MSGRTVHRDGVQPWRYVLLVQLEGTVTAGERETAERAALDDARATLDSSPEYLAIGDLEVIPLDSTTAIPTEGPNA